MAMAIQRDESGLGARHIEQAGARAMLEAVGDDDGDGRSRHDDDGDRGDTEGNIGFECHGSLSEQVAQQAIAAPELARGFWTADGDFS
jgi:hypothetical protein